MEIQWEERHVYGPLVGHARRQGHGLRGREGDTVRRMPPVAPEPLPPLPPPPWEARFSLHPSAARASSRHPVRVRPGRAGVRSRGWLADIAAGRDFACAIDPEGALQCQCSGWRGMFTDPGKP